MEETGLKEENAIDRLKWRDALDKLLRSMR